MSSASIPPPRLGDRRDRAVIVNGHCPGMPLTPQERDFVRSEMAVLTEREAEVVFAVCEGGGNSDIADRLCVALPTLRTHLMRIHQKLGTANKSDIALLVAGLVLDAYRTGRFAASSVARLTDALS